MDIPIVTDEQRERFTKEFEEWWALPYDAAWKRDRNYGALREMWVLLSAYREMQTENLLGSAYRCQQCGMPTVNVATVPDIDLQCPECGWVPVEVIEQNASTRT